MRRRRKATNLPVIGGESMAQELSFELASDERAEGEAFLVDVDGFEGPLDLLLELARRQKVDLARISILALAEQYLAFIEAARRVRLELAADYLVMAAWLAYLKSRLLLPEPPKGDEPSAADLAAALADRLRRLEPFAPPPTGSGARAARPRHVSARRPGRRRDDLASNYQASLYDLLSAYARQRQKTRDVARDAAAAQRSGRSPRRARRWSGWPASRRNGPCSTIFCCIIAWTFKRRARCAPRLFRPRSKWCGRGASTFGRTAPSRRSGCEAAGRPTGPRAFGLAGPAPEGSRPTGRRGMWRRPLRPIELVRRQRDEAAGA